MQAFLKKQPYISYSLLEKLIFLKKNNLKSVLKTWSRSSMIIPKMIGQTISVYNGQKHISIYITDQYVGYKLGEFVNTRIFHSHKKKTDRKIKNKK
jgi:small subunit ribosomal protein S19